MPYKDKSGAIKRIMDEIFPNSSMKVNLGICPFCSTVVTDSDFDGELSRKEFEISGLCQKCQDETFK